MRVLRLQPKGESDRIPLPASKRTAMAQDHSNDPPKNDPNAEASENPRKPKKFRRWIIIPVVILLLLILLLILAPTILSTGSAREMVLNSVNKQYINGKLDIQDWSFSWTGGIHVHGITLDDPSNAHVASIGDITCGLSLAKALTGNLDLGDVEINGLDFNARRDQNGQINIQSLFKPTSNSNPSPGKLPNIKGVIHLNKATGTFEDDLPEQHQLVNLQEIDGTLEIKDINQPIADSISINGTLDQQIGANVKIDGTVSAVQNNLLDLTQLGGGQKIHLAVADTSPGTSQMIDLLLDTEVQLGGPTFLTIPSVQISQGSIDLHRMQEQGLLDMVTMKWLANHGVRINSGKITLAGTGKLDASGFGFQQPLAVHIDPIDFSVKDEIAGTQTSRLPPLDLLVSGSAGNLTAHLTIDAAANPILAADATVQPDSNGMQFNVSRCNGDIARLQAAYGPALPLFVSAPTSTDTTQPASQPIIQLISQNVIVVNAGKFSMTTSGSIEPSASSAKLTASVTNLTVQQSGQNTPINAMNLNLAAGGTLAGGANGQSLSNLTVNLDTPFAKLSVSNPGSIPLADLNDNSRLAVQTSIVADGDVAQLCRLAETFTGQPVNAYPYKGSIHFEESIKKDPSQPDIKITGGGSASQFQVLGSDGSVLLAEDQIPIHDDCDYNVPSNSIAIDKSDPLTIELKQSGALSLSVIGGISDLVGQRNISGVSINLNYDLAKLWPIVKPLLPPAQQQKLSDLIISGKQQKTFAISGSFPSDKPFKQAVASLYAAGVFTVDSLSTNGVTVQKLDIPITLKDGVARTVYSDQPEGKNAPKPATCNGGTLDIGILSLDLTGDTMLLSMPGIDAKHPHQLLQNIELNQTMARQILGSAMTNPLFGGDSTASQGFVDLSILNCQNVPLSQLLTQQSPQNTGQAEVHYSIRQMRVGGGLLALLGVNNNTPASINNADVQLAGGKVTQDTTLTLNQAQAVHLYGTVGLQTMGFMPMTIGIPPSLLPAQWVPNRSILAYMPDEIQIPVEGTVSNPKLRYDKVLPGLISSATQKMLLGNLTGQKPNTPGSNQNSQQQNPLNNLLQGLTNPKK